MKITKDIEQLIDLYRKLESQKCKEDLIFHAETILHAQDALKSDYGLEGSDAALCNGTAGNVL